MEEKYFIVQWTITTLCQQRCRHCYISNDSFNKLGPSKQRCYEVIDKLLAYSQANNKELLLLLTGGDPLLRFDISEILEYICNHNIKYIIMGNPYEINQSSVKMLKKNAILEYQLSLDGTELLHDQIRKKECYLQTKNAIEYLNDGGIPVNLMVTVSRDNWLVLEELIYLAERMKVTSISFGRLVPIGKGAEYRDKLLSPLEHRQVIERILKTKLQLIKRNGSLKIIFKEDMLWPLYADEMGVINEDNKSYFEAYKCGIFKSYLAIDYNGDVYPCRRLPVVIGNIFFDSVDDLLHHELRNKIRELSNHEKCNKCKLNFSCVGCVAQKYDCERQIIRKDIHCWKNDSVVHDK